MVKSQITLDPTWSVITFKRHKTPAGSFKHTYKRTLES